MTNYNIGYYNKPWNETDFVIIAQTKSEVAAEFIRKSYNDGYKARGLDLTLTIVADSDLPSDFRFSCDK